MTRPLLTIAVPTFEREEYVLPLARALASRADDSIEIVVSDNASRDDTWARLTALALDFPCVRPYRMPVNIGCDANYLRLVEYARGTWIWFVGDDEMVDADCVAALTRRLRREDAGAIHLAVPDSATWLRSADGAFFQNARDLVHDFPSLLDLQILSSVIVRRDLGLEALRDAYALAGHLHAYTPLVIHATAAMGLRVYQVPGLRLPPRAGTKRWPQFAAHFGAWVTIRSAAADATGKDVDVREYSERRGPLSRMLLLHALGLVRQHIRPSDLSMLRSFLPRRAITLRAAIAVTHCLGALPSLAALAGLWALHVRFRRDVRAQAARQYGVPTAGSLVRAIRLRTSSRPTSHDY